MTQEQIEAGWKMGGLEIASHTIRQKENFWKVAKEHHVDIDTIVVANPDLKKLSAAHGQTVRVPNQKGVIHQTLARELLLEISLLYNVSDSSNSTINNL